MTRAASRRSWTAAPPVVAGCGRSTASSTAASRSRRDSRVWAVLTRSPPCRGSRRRGPGGAGWSAARRWCSRRRACPPSRPSRRPW
ncbi:hypothetical protein QR97_16810 [Streptomyces sp. PBH53]|nr:hypothetical protein QR97_16810 [Streptomyces sp. PBH53]